MLFIFIFFKILFIVRERGGEEEEREKNVDVQEIHQLVASCRLPTRGTWPTTQACAQTGNRTGGLLFHRPVLNSLSHTSQGYIF